MTGQKRVVKKPKSGGMLSVSVFLKGEPMMLKKLSQMALAIGGAAMLVACGGDPTLTVKGTAATGDPLDGAEVVATCKSGTGSATSTGTGTYTVNVNNGEGPCLIKASKGSTVLYSVSSGTGATQTANVTPLTNLFVTYLLNAGTGTAPATPEAWFGNTANQTFLAQPELVATYVAPFVAVINSIAGSTVIDSTVASSFLSGTFTAAAGNPVDDALEALKTANVVTSTGAPSTATTTAVIVAADVQVPPSSGTGATGATGAGS